MSFVTVTFLVALVVALSAVDNQLLKTRITPFGVMSFPYVSVVLCALLFAPALGFVSLSAKSLVVWICGLSLTWLVGQFLFWIIGYATITAVCRRLTSVFPDEAVTLRLSRHLALLTVPLLLLNLVLSVKSTGGWSEITSPEFKSAYIQGVLAHILVFSELLFIVLLGTLRREDSLQRALLFALFGFLLIGQVKGRILEAVIAGVLYRIIRGRSSVSPRLIGVVVLSGLLVFGLIYYSAIVIVDPTLAFKSDTFSFLGRHASFYLMVGVLGFSETLGSGKADVGGSAIEVFGPFVNIYRLLTGSGTLVSPSSSHAKGSQVDLLQDAVAANSNVYTLFGTLYIYIGALGAMLYVIAMAFVCYSLLLAAAASRNSWLLAIYCYLSAQLSLGFFEFYFWHLDTYEIAVYGTALAGLSYMAGPGRSSADPSAIGMP